MQQNSPSDHIPGIECSVTAGLTVMFQDFILAFCGWFVLMGRNGVRVGDWVEIDGVGGEVVEVGLFRTWLLETGTWTANGHPTGRRVSFLKGYAIRGKYFNFHRRTVDVGRNQGEYSSRSPGLTFDREDSRSNGQGDRGRREDGGRGMETGDARGGCAAFQCDAFRGYAAGGGGLDIVVRYVTRAGVRLETRNRLFGTVVELMQGAREVSEQSKVGALGNG